MKLDAIEKQSALWRKIEAHLLSRLALMRQRNDGNLDPTETAKVRGRITELKDLIALGEPSPVDIADEQ